jgi:predicted nuclease of predicted toxin-antitoxin system
MMPWSPLPDPPKEVVQAFRGKARILVDESLGPGVAKLLREQGCNVVYASDVGLGGKDDEDVAAYAWRENRMIWTHDHDYLDDKLLPEHRNPGVVVLPGGDGEEKAMLGGIRTALTIFGHGGQMWKKSKTVVTANGELTMRVRDPSGRTTSERYRLTKDGVEMWSERSSTTDHFGHACKMGLEGIVSKQRDLPYRSGPGEKLDQGQEPREPSGTTRQLRVQRSQAVTLRRAHRVLDGVAPGHDTASNFLSPGLCESEHRAYGTTLLAKADLANPTLDRLSTGVEDVRPRSLVRYSVRALVRHPRPAETLVRPVCGHSADTSRVRFEFAPFPEQLSEIMGYFGGSSRPALDAC